MFRLRPSDVTSVISVTVAGMVAGFTILFGNLLYQMADMALRGGAIFTGVTVLPYLTIEGGFIAVVIAGACKALRRKPLAKRTARKN